MTSNWSFLHRNSFGKDVLLLVRKNQYRNELISEIKTLAQSNGLNTVFTTFLEITATSIAAQMDPQNAEEREKRYQEIASKMTPEMLSSYARMFALLTLVTRAHAEDPCDILGAIYHELRLNNEWNGLQRMRIKRVLRRVRRDEWSSVWRVLCDCGVLR